MGLGLHGEAFDPDSATAAEFRQMSVSLWQRYSPVIAHPMYTPLGEDAGLYLGQGANHIAYLLCYLRVDAILHTRHGTTMTGSTATKVHARDVTQRCLSPEFASRVRSQLLDPVFSGQRLATLLPVLGSPEPRTQSARSPPAHPLPPPPTDAVSFFKHMYA